MDVAHMDVPHMDVADDAPDPITDAAILLSAGSSPILGEQLKQVFEETNLQSPLATADKLEGMADELEDKLNEKARQQAKRCWQLNFAEPAIEADFREITFEGQCSTYRRAACTLALALAGFAAYDVWVFACAPRSE